MTISINGNNSTYTEFEFKYYTSSIVLIGVDRDYREPIFTIGSIEDVISVNGVSNNYKYFYRLYLAMLNANTIVINTQQATGGGEVNYGSDSIIDLGNRMNEDSIMDYGNRLS